MFDRNWKSFSGKFSHDTILLTMKYSKCKYSCTKYNAHRLRFTVAPPQSQFTRDRFHSELLLLPFWNIYLFVYYWFEQFLLAALPEGPNENKKPFESKEEIPQTELITAPLPHTRYHLIHDTVFSASKIVNLQIKTLKSATYSESPTQPAKRGHSKKEPLSLSTYIQPWQKLFKQILECVSGVIFSSPFLNKISSVTKWNQCLVKCIDAAAAIKMGILSLPL